jgi:glycerol-3-phosphate dehydrogenase
MTAIPRDIAAAQGKRYDVVVVGGGIYGAMALMHAAARGLSALLLERSDFGGATSFNSLRVMHGGLRFLQSLDIPRSREMIAARAWLLEHFPELVAPLSCLMPLYNQGLRRTWTLGPALGLDNLLSAGANAGLRPDRRIAPGHLVGPQGVRRLFPQVNAAGLKGGAIWQDALLADSNRLITETLRWAGSMGAAALNYTAAGELLTHDRQVRGITAIDEISGERFEVESKVIINAAGPGSRACARLWDRDIPRLFQPSLAWNLLFDRPQLSDHALAVSAPATSPEQGQVYFLVPWKGKVLAGTGHSSSTTPASTHVSEQQIEAMIKQINASIPGLDLNSSEVTHVFSGLLPVRRPGSTQLASREVIYDHGRHQGPRGLFSVSGVKLVAAPIVASKVISAVCERCLPSQSAPHTLPPRP